MRRIGAIGGEEPAPTEAPPRRSRGLPLVEEEIERLMKMLRPRDVDT